MDNKSEPKVSGFRARKNVPGPQTSVGPQHRPRGSSGQGSVPSLQHDALRPGKPAKHDSLLRSHSLLCPDVPPTPHCTTAPCPDSRQRTSPGAQQRRAPALQAWPTAQHLPPHAMRPTGHDAGTQAADAANVMLSTLFRHAAPRGQHLSSQQVLPGGQHCCAHGVKPSAISPAHRVYSGNHHGLLRDRHLPSSQYSSR